MEKSILLAYVITVISETIIILLVQKPKNIWIWILSIFLINSFTHPIAIYLFHIQNVSYFIVEFGVIITELICYKLIFNLSWKRAFIISSIANIFSILAGFTIRLLLGL